MQAVPVRGAAAVHLVDRLERQLQRGELRRFTQRARGDLVHGHASRRIDTFRPLRRGTRQPGRLHALMRPGIIGKRLLAVKPADDQKVILEPFQRLHNRGQFQRALSGRCPRRHGETHRRIDCAQASDRLGRRHASQRRHRGNHRVQHRQRNRRPQPAQDRPPRDELLGHNPGGLSSHDVSLLIRQHVRGAMPSHDRPQDSACLIRNGVLFTMALTSADQR